MHYPPPPIFSLRGDTDTIRPRMIYVAFDRDSCPNSYEHDEFYED